MAVFVQINTESIEKFKMFMKQKSRPKNEFFGLFFEEMNEKNENHEAIKFIEYILLSLYLHGKQ